MGREVRNCTCRNSAVHIMVHHRVFFSSSPGATTGVIALAGSDSAVAESVDADLMNSPVATSVEVLVLITAGTVGDDENHPPGKNREEVVDSILLREAGSSTFAFVSDVVKCSCEGLIPLVNTSRKRLR